MKKANIKVALVMLLIALVPMACFTIYEVDQPGFAGPSQPFQVRISASTNEPDSNAKFGILGLQVPDDFTVSAIAYDYAMGSGTFHYLHPDSSDSYPSTVDLGSDWVDSLELLYPSAVGMHWEVWESNESYAPVDSLNLVEFMIDMVAGTALADYELGYVFTESSLDFDEDGYWDSNLGNPLSVTNTVPGTVLDDFETDIGNWLDPNYSGSTSGLDLSSSFAVSTDYAKNGTQSGKLTLIDDTGTAGGWFLRMNNRTDQIAPDSKIGFWLRASGQDSLRFVIWDNGIGGDGYEAGPWMVPTVTEDDWQWFELDLATAEFTGWITGNGEINSTNYVTIESIQMTTSFDINDTLYIDDITEIEAPAVPYAAVTFQVDASANPTAFSGGFLKGSWDADGYFDSGWGGGVEHATFDDTDGDNVWEATVDLVSDGGTNTWSWGINDLDHNWVTGGPDFTVPDESAQTVTYTYSAPIPVDVTFRVNSSTVEGIVDSTSGVDLRGTVTQWGPGTNLDNVGGDYWELTISLYANTAYEYKYGAQTVDPLDGTVTDFWENDIPGADYQGPNRSFTTGTTDMVLDLDYLGSGPDNNVPPYTATADTVDIYLRINMSQNGDFNPASDILSVVGHFPHEGNANMWSPGTYQALREGTSNYFGFHLKLAQTYIDTVDNFDWDGMGIFGLHGYRFAIGTDWSNSENLGGAYVPLNENRALLLHPAMGDTTIQWVYWNDAGPEPFGGETDLLPFTFTTDVSNAVSANGFALGDTLLIKYGYGGTQPIAITDTLTQVPFSYDYTLVLDTLTVDLERGLFYNYYRIKNGTEYREIFYNFDYEGSPPGLAERRFEDLSGASANNAYTIADDVDSRDHPRRQPLFRNTDQLGQAVTVTFAVDLRPAYYQVMAGDTLEDIQGDHHVTVADSIFAWGVWINGPATGGWAGWGSTLHGTVEQAMHDDGTTGGDLYAGDSVYSVQFDYEATDIVGQEFKFGIDAGDNEGGYGNNHIENIDVSSPVLLSYFGSIDPVFYDAWDYDTNTPSLGVDELEDAMPTVFSLSNNYPNPFNPSTKIQFTVPIGAELTLNIYNILGQTVATIHNGYAKPGTYELTWNGRDMNGKLVPSGVYLYELDAGAYFHAVKKMTILK